MADYLIKGETLTGIADAIRRKTGSTEDIKAKDMESNIDSISTGTDTSDATASANDILSGKTAYVDGEKITGAMPTASLSPLMIAVDSNGLIRATSLIEQSGYFEGGEEKSSTKQLTTKSATTHMPSTSDTTIPSGTYLTGTQTIKGDANLVSENIVEGVSIFGVEGSATTGGGSVGGIETCSLLIPTYANQLTNISYVKCENGNCTQIETTPLTSNVSISNILCNSIICIQYLSYYPPTATAQNCTHLISQNGYAFFKLTAPANGTATINVVYNDF